MRTDSRTRRASELRRRDREERMLMSGADLDCPPSSPFSSLLSMAPKLVPKQQTQTQTAAASTAAVAGGAGGGTAAAAAAAVAGGSAGGAGAATAGGGQQNQLVGR
eukprot:3941584-Rhodomonas_salina.2